MNETFWKNVRPVPRTMDEAYRTPAYAQSIWAYKSEHQRGVSALVNKITELSLLLLYGVAVSAFTLWLTRS